MAKQRNNGKPSASSLFREWDGPEPDGEGARPIARGKRATTKRSASWNSVKTKQVTRVFSEEEVRELVDTAVAKALANANVTVDGRVIDDQEEITSISTDEEEFIVGGQ